jgi:hypothetical protein
LELGHEMRRRLLEAAVAGGAVSDGKVVRIDRPDPDETEGFDWLVGEAPASEKLMLRMIQDPVFLDSLDQQRGFILTLREALRRTAAATAVSGRRRRWLPAAVMSAAAALAMAAGIVFFKPTAKAPEVTAGMGGTSSTVESEHRPGFKVLAALEESRDTPASTEPSPFASGIAGVTPPASADPGGTGRSVEPDDPLMAPQLAGALELPAEESPMPAPLLAMLEEKGRSSESSSEGDGSQSLLAGGRPVFPVGDHFGGFGMPGEGPGTALTGPVDGPDDETIPEPGGVLPVMIGLMMLLLRRPCREKAAA